MSLVAENHFPVPHWYCDCGYEKMVPWTWNYCAYCERDKPEDAIRYPANWVGKSSGVPLETALSTWQYEKDGSAKKKDRKDKKDKKGDEKKRKDGRDKKGGGGGGSSSKSYVRA